MPPITELSLHHIHLFIEVEKSLISIPIPHPHPPTPTPHLLLLLLLPYNFSFDVRDAKIEKGSHWVDEQKLGGRAYFQASGRPSAALVVDNTTSTDGGLYRCRVDFHKSPTRNARVQLRVISKFEITT